MNEERAFKTVSSKNIGKETTASLFIVLKLVGGDLLVIELMTFPQMLSLNF